MAAPRIVNLVAKCKLLAPELTPEQLKQLLNDTSDPRPEWEGLVKSGGLVNTDRAMRLAALYTLAGPKDADGRNQRNQAADALAVPPFERTRLLKLLTKLGR
jgi:hypothetical protein